MALTVDEDFAVREAARRWIRAITQAQIVDGTVGEASLSRPLMDLLVDFDKGVVAIERVATAQNEMVQVIMASVVALKAKSPDRSVMQCVDDIFEAKRLIFSR